MKGEFIHAAIREQVVKENRLSLFWLHLECFFSLRITPHWENRFPASHSIVEIIEIEQERGKSVRLEIFLDRR